MGFTSRSISSTDLSRFVAELEEEEEEEEDAVDEELEAGEAAAADDAADDQFEVADADFRRMGEAAVEDPLEAEKALGRSRNSLSTTRPKGSRRSRYWLEEMNRFLPAFIRPPIEDPFCRRRASVSPPGTGF